MMIWPSDKVYLQTKAIKRGSKVVASRFAELAKWTSSACGAAVLNIHFDRVPPGDRPRLSIILDRERDSLRLHDDPVVASRVAERLRQTLEEADAPVDLEGLFVIFVSFELVARTEANQRATEADLSAIKSSLPDAHLWFIRPSWDQVTFFFYTDAELRASESSNLRKRCADAYAALMSRYDEFGYLREHPIAVTFESKENFDKTYKGSWFLYDR